MIKATFKSLLARKLRLVLSGLAVVLAVTFISGAFVLTDTLGRTFDSLFANVYQYTDLEVSAKPALEASGFPVPRPAPAGVVEQVERVSGVASAEGYVVANGARILTERGKVLVNQTGTQLGASWEDDDPVMRLREGTPPQAEDQVVLNAQAAKDGDFAVGDTVNVITPADQERHAFRVVGIAGYSGGRDSLGGEHMVFFTEPVAQQLMLGQTGVFSNIAVDVEDGAKVTTVQADLQRALGPDYQVETGEELAEKSAAPLKTIFTFFNRILLGFGAVALLVGVFLILNTFSIIIAQRTRELALMRAMGASRGQMIGSVLLEAFVVGLIGSALGLLAGIGLGWLGAWALGNLLGGGRLEVAGITVPLASVISAFGIGITVTMLAALVPALRAARVPPVAAMHDSATPDRPLTRITVAGAVVTAIGVALLVWGLTGAGDATLPLILAGVLAGLVGVALLTPIVCRPVVGLLGRIFSWSVPGKLGRRNSSRNPRRTAITAAAVMIGIALITGISTIVSSVNRTVSNTIQEQLQADLIISGQQTSEIPPVINQDDLAEIKALPEVASSAAVTYEFFAKAGDRDAIVFAYDDWAAARQVLEIRPGEGDIGAIDPGEVVVDHDTAEDRDLKVGDPVTLTLPKGERTFTLVGITAETQVNTGYVISPADARDLFRSAAPNQAYLKLTEGASVSEVKDTVDALLVDSPEVTVQTRDEFVSSQTFFFDFLLNAVQVLLLVAIAISVLGIINTLVLSVLERTRELGMLRAIGLRRGQTMRMITVESVVISLFGTILGLGVGLGLGLAVVDALRDQGITETALPWGLMVLYLIAALFIGVGAAIIPAIRAARLNVLNAIAYE
jgi:putative ABC transport system permease protein